MVMVDLLMMSALESASRAVGHDAITRRQFLSVRLWLGPNDVAYCGGEAKRKRQDHVVPVLLRTRQDRLSDPVVLADQKFGLTDVLQ
jgi:hypothetical protein